MRDSARARSGARAMTRLACLFVVAACGAPQAPVAIPPDVSSPAPTTSTATPTPPSSASSAAPTTAATGASSPRETIDRALELLAAHRYEELISTLIDPADLEKLAVTSTVAETAQKFEQEGKDKELVKLLTAVRDDTPVMSAQKHTANYEHGQETLRLHEVNGRWYIKN